MPQLGRSAALTGFLELCGELGLDAGVLAQGAGLPTEVLTNPDLRVPMSAMARMYEAASERSGVEEFALRVAETRRISNLGGVGLVIREQPTVGKAIQAYIRYQWLQNEAFALSAETLGQDVLLRLRGPATRGRQAEDLALAVAVKALQSLMGAHWRPQDVLFEHGPPVSLAVYRRVFGVTPRFGQELMGLIVSRADLERPIPNADPVIAAGVAQYLDQLMRARPVALVEQVGDLIVALLPDGQCSADRVARRLAMDRRTLHRRLAAEGATFSALVDQKRREMAATLLTSSRRPLQSVAGLLGFSSLSAFAHWFRRSFAQSASAYRAQHGAAGGDDPMGLASLC